MTTEVTLRELALVDIPVLAALEHANRTYIGRYMTAPPRDVVQQVRTLTDAYGAARRGRRREWVIEVDARIVGRVSGEIVQDCQDWAWEVTLWVCEEMAGKGIGTDGLMLMLAAARVRGVPRVWARIWGQNDASLRAFAKAGFTFSRHEGASQIPRVRPGMVTCVKEIAVANS